jgi:hypothetical protein
MLCFFGFVAIAVSLDSIVFGGAYTSAFSDKDFGFTNLLRAFFANSASVAASRKIAPQTPRRWQGL